MNVVSSAGIWTKVLETFKLWPDGESQRISTVIVVHPEGNKIWQQSSHRWWYSRCFDDAAAHSWCESAETVWLHGEKKSRSRVRSFQPAAAVIMTVFTASYQQLAWNLRTSPITGLVVSAVKIHVLLLLMMRRSWMRNTVCALCWVLQFDTHTHNYFLFSLFPIFFKLSIYFILRFFFSLRTSVWRPAVDTCDQWFLSFC